MADDEHRKDEDLARKLGLVTEYDDDSDELHPNDQSEADDRSDDSAEHRIGSIPYSSIAPPGAANGPAGRLDFAVIAIRLVALYYIVTALPVVLLLPAQLFNSYQSARYVIMEAAPTAALGVVGIVVWFLSKPVGRWMLLGVPAVTPPAPKSRVSAAHLQSLVFSFIGLLLAVYAMRHLSYLITLVTDPPFEGMERDHSFAIRATVIDFAVEMAVAVAVFFGARGLSQLWYRVRSTSH